jgi:SAM-dependent methyltransferase
VGPHGVTRKSPKAPAQRTRSPGPRASRRSPASVASPPPPFDRFTCYEHCVQNPARLVPFLYALHGGRPQILREDFCGTGGVCRAWARAEGLPRGHPHPLKAIGVDLDPEPLLRLRNLPNVRAVRADVLDCPARADIISATNFPIGYWHTPPQLLEYLRLTRGRLRRGGIFVCDTYGGATAFTTGTLQRDIRTEDGARIHYTWQQREADPITAMVTDVLHFRATRDGEVIYQEAEAFIYRWRLWSIPELRDAFAEAGFRQADVYAELGDAVDSDRVLYVHPAEDLPESFVVLLAART